eukprot:g38005.t1
MVMVVSGTLSVKYDSGKPAWCQGLVSNSSGGAPDRGFLTSVGPEPGVRNSVGRRLWRSLVTEIVGLEGILDVGNTNFQGGQWLDSLLLDLVIAKY